jgi:hypothetical protein
MSGPTYPSTPDPTGAGQNPPPAPPSVGYPAQPPPAYPQQYAYGAPGYAVPQQGNGLAVAALVLGILSVVFSWVPFFDWVLAVLAVIFGAVGISTANKRMGAGKGMAVAGLVLGLITVVLGIVFVIFVFSFFHGVCSQPGVTCG